jgi:hypothetical protein
MTRYFYAPHTDKEVPLTYHYLKYCYVYNPTTGKPMRMPYWKTNEDWLLFHTHQDCINYYKGGMQ